MAKITDNEIQNKGREIAIRLDYLMAKVDESYNRHQRCLVCNEQYKHHIDGLPCLADNKPKQIIRTDRWGNVTKK
jgi:plasmid rolling circle replication initiator protein Rep|tara:strand:+ start:976 stop:1200 length:225 start_codon:yes stop_codon:yes gene_type:complete